MTSRDTRRAGVSPGFLLIALGALILACAAGGTAQSDARTASPLESTIGQLQAQRTAESGIPLGATLNPGAYTVGPADVLSVNLWISPPVQYRLEVTPEGTLIVPSVGEIRVAGMLLSDAKERILDAVKKRYVTVDATVTLVRPRAIIVSVRGAVLHEGEYTMYATARADGAIHEANKPARSEESYALDAVLREMSSRRIVLRHNDGTMTQVDLVKFLATKEDSLNPYLREGDVVIVPRMDVTKNVFGIYGEVNLPGRYEYVAGDMLSDALRIGQGITREARADSAEFFRLSADGRSMEARIIDLTALETGALADFPIAPGDRIVVRSGNDWRADFRVHVEGEVLYPGTYPITRDRTKISEVIRGAGGFTEFAALGSAELNRRSVMPEEVELDRLMSLRGGVSQEDSLDYVRETDLRLRKEIVNVDFAGLFAGGDSTQDLYLQDGDVIRIPSVKRTIYVFGQIVSPGHIPYVRGEGPDYYVRKAGGYTDRARQDDIRIIKSTTKQWLGADETDVEEGDYLWVPKESDRSFSYYMTTASQAAGVLSVIIGMAAVIISVSK